MATNFNQQFPYARTNIQTVRQRAQIIKDFLPKTHTIAEICCGDFTRQDQVYRRELGAHTAGLDLNPDVVAYDKAKGLDCYHGNALDAAIMRKFLAADVLFFGPPLSPECTGHNVQSVAQVQPSFDDFIDLLIGALRFQGALVCICPKQTNMGDIQQIYKTVKKHNERYNLFLIHHSHATVTGRDEPTEKRLKYVELWFATTQPDEWHTKYSES